MAQKDLHHRITGDSTSLERASQRGAGALTSMERESRRLERQQQRTHAAMTQTGRGMFLAGAAIAAGLALSVKAAVEWESAWAGVLKTVDGTDAQMAALEEEIRSLTGVLPATHREIAAVAEAAGQLGVQRQNVAAFTKTMIDMGEATNLTSDEAATSIARLMNIMQTAPGDVERLASTIVDLGNKGATTESEITEMALRIAGAARTIGLTEQQVVGFAAALSNVGIRAEAGGTAISKVFLEIDSAVSAGGDNLEVFAETAGMTADQFRQAYERDAGAAIATFVAGLARVQSSGGDVNAILAQLGLTEIRVSDALRRLAGSGDNLAQSLQTGSQAWQENNALATEAERRYETTAAKVAIAKNQLNDFAIDVGNGLLPVLGGLAENAADVARVISGLPGPAKTALAVLAVLTATVLLLGGATLMLVPRIAATRAALIQMGVTAAGVRNALASLQAFMFGPWGAALLAAGVVVASVIGAVRAWNEESTRAKERQQEIKQIAEEVSGTLNEQTGALTENTRTWAFNRLEQLNALEAAKAFGLSLETVVDAALGESDALAEVNRVMNEQGRIMPEVAGANRAMNDQQRILAHALGLTSEELDAAIQRYRDQIGAVEGATSATERLDPATRDLAVAFEVSAGAAEDVAGAVDDLDEELKQLFDRVFGLQNAQDDLADAFDALTEKIQEQKDAGVEGAGSLEGMSEAARENRDLAQELLEKFGELTLETIRSTGSQEEAEAAAKNFKDRLEDLAEQTGTNVEDLEGYNDVVAEIERLIEVTFQTPGVTAAEAAAERLRRKLANIDRTVTISFKTQGFAPVGAIRIPGAQHGGEVPGPFTGIDRVPAMLTAGEFVIRRSEAQRHKALLADINSGRFARAQHLGSGGQVKAAAELLRRLQSGGQFFEDFTFRGHSATVGRFHQQLADQFYGSGGKFHRGQLESFLRKASQPAPPPAPRLADAAWAARNMTGRWSAQPAPRHPDPLGAVLRAHRGGNRSDFIMVKVFLDGREVRGATKQVIRHELRTDRSFQDDVRQAVR